MERKRQADQEAYYEDAPADVKQSGAESYATDPPSRFKFGRRNPLIVRHGSAHRATRLLLLLSQGRLPRCSPSTLLLSLESLFVRLG